MIDTLARAIGLPARAIRALLVGAFAVALLGGIMALLAIVRLRENY